MLKIQLCLLWTIVNIIRSNLEKKQNKSNMLKLYDVMF